MALQTCLVNVSSIIDKMLIPESDQLYSIFAVQDLSITGIRFGEVKVGYIVLNFKTHTYCSLRATYGTTWKWRLGRMLLKKLIMSAVLVKKKTTIFMACHILKQKWDVENPFDHQDVLRLVFERKCVWAWHVSVGCLEVGVATDMGFCVISWRFEGAIRSS